MSLGASVVVSRRVADATEFLILRRRYAPGPDWKWTFPSGAREPGESVEACARRELLEETGLALPLRSTPCSRREWAIYAAEAPPEARVILDHEHDGFEWLSLEEALVRCRPQVVADGLACVAAWLGEG